jgi:hypothetical protein
MFSEQPSYFPQQTYLPEEAWHKLTLPLVHTQGKIYLPLFQHVIEN